MSILGSANYVIKADFMKDGDIPQTTDEYVGNYDTLRRTIGTTWSQRQIIVKVEGMIATVLEQESGIPLATFTFEAFQSKAIPEHF